MTLISDKRKTGFAEMTQMAMTFSAKRTLTET